MTICNQPDPMQFGLQPNGRYIPGRDAIKKECAEIQARWSAAERLKRHAWAQSARVTPQQIAVKETAIQIFER